MSISASAAAVAQLPLYPETRRSRSESRALGIERAFDVPFVAQLALKESMLTCGGSHRDLDLFLRYRLAAAHRHPEDIPAATLRGHLKEVEGSHQWALLDVAQAAGPTLAWPLPARGLRGSEEEPPTARQTGVEDQPPPVLVVSRQADELATETE